MNLENKIAIITGASIGIGRATAIEFARQGAIVGLLSRSVRGLAETLQSVNDIGGTGRILQTDLSQTRSIQETAKQIRDAFSHIDFLANIAGVWHDDNKPYFGITFNGYTAEEIENVYRVGVIGTALLTHSLAPIIRRGGIIINMSCYFKEGEAKGCVPYYGACKSIEHLTKALSEEFDDKGIMAYCIAPSYVATEPCKRYFPEQAQGSIAIQPIEVAKSIVGLTTGDHKLANGQTLIISKE